MLFEVKHEFSPETLVINTRQTIVRVYIEEDLTGVPRAVTTIQNKKRGGVPKLAKSIALEICEQFMPCADAASWNLASDFNGVAEVGDVHACGSALSGQGGPACLFGIRRTLLTCTCCQLVSNT